MGLQIYSLRYAAKKDLPGTLALIRGFGFEEVEVSGLYGRSAAEFRTLLDDTGLRATSMMASYARLDSAVASVADEASTLGAEYVVCSTIPHKNYLTMEECLRASEALDRFGEGLAASGLRGCYHIHGTEFAKSPDGDVFDTLAKRTDPKLTNFEMDIYWVVYARRDPVTLLRKYPGRFPLMHVKDIRPDTPLAGLPRDVLEEESVPLGSGLVDIPPTLKAAQETGVLHYYIEDEAVNAAEQIPLSLKYLDSIRP